MDQHKGQINILLEDTWFFGNTLKNKSKSPKTMVRCNSDPSTSTSSTKGSITSNNNGLLRTPSLPVSLGKDEKYEFEEEEEEEEDDEFEPRMGDLIRQAMPIPISRPNNTRRLDRAPSLPPCLGTSKGLSVTSDVQNSRKLCKRVVSVGELSPLVQEIKKSPIGMVKLSRRGSLDSSLPPKYTSKGTKQSGLNSKNNKTSTKLEPKIQTLNKNKSQKSPSNQETKELQGFKDLDLSLGNMNVGPNVTHKLPGLQRRASLGPEFSRKWRPNVSGTGQEPSSTPFEPPLVTKWVDHKPMLTQDMKDRIRFWARAVASNVRQEC